MACTESMHFIVTALWRCTRAAALGPHNQMDVLHVGVNIASMRLLCGL